MNIPLRSEAITPEWLTDALTSSEVISHSWVTAVAAVVIGEKEGYTGSLARLDVTYSDTDEDAPASLVAKFAPHDAELRDTLRDSNRREVMFYRHIASDRPAPVPRCYYSDIDLRTGSTILLLEDMTRLRGVPLAKGCTPEDALVAVTGMARIHTAWWDDPALRGFDWTLSYGESPFAEWWDQYPAIVRDLMPDLELPKPILELGDIFATQLAKVREVLEGSPATCIHRDLHVDNLLFGRGVHDPSLVIVDWQDVGRGKGASDVGYLLISSLPTALRRQSEREIIETYYAHLQLSGVTGYSFDECWTDYRLSALAKLYVTVEATVLLDNSPEHRRAWRRADLQRLEAFMQDHSPLRLLA